MVDFPADRAIPTQNEAPVSGVPGIFTPPWYNYLRQVDGILRRIVQQLPGEQEGVNDTLTDLQNQIDALTIALAVPIVPQDLDADFGVVTHQIVAVNFTTPHASTTQFPTDNTIPQNNEGALAFLQSFTPKSGTSKVKIEFVGSLQASQGGGVGIFRSGSGNALVVRLVGVTTVNLSLPITVVVDSWGEGVANDIMIRTGSGNPANTVNIGLIGTAYGASEVTSLVITEYEATPIS